MRKIIGLVMICLLTSTVIANASAPVTPGSDDSSSLKNPFSFLKNASKTTTGDNSSGLYHITPVKGTTDRYMLVIGKMEDTRVRLDIYDKEGNLIYATTRKADKDLAKVIVLKKMNGASFVLSDNNGASRRYTFGE